MSKKYEVEELNYSDTVLLIDALKDKINKKEKPGTFVIDLLLKLERNKRVLYDTPEDCTHEKHIDEDKENFEDLKDRLVRTSKDRNLLDYVIIKADGYNLKLSEEDTEGLFRLKLNGRDIDTLMYKMSEFDFTLTEALVREE